MADLLSGGGGYVPTEVLAKRGVAAAGCLIGGVGLLVLGILPNIMGIAAGVLAAFVGIGAAASRESDDRKGGLIVAAAGLLSILARIPVIGRFAAPLMGLGAAVLIGLGIWNGVKFLKGLKSRT